MNALSDADPQPAKPQHAVLSGRWLVALTLSLFLLVPAITYLAWQMTRGEPPRLELDYADREDWFMMPVSPRPLTYNTFVAAETGKQYKKTDLTLDPEVEQALQRCVKLTQDDRFVADATRDELLALAQDERLGFYPPYLLASWYWLRHSERNEDYKRWIGIAFERADGALAQRFIDVDGRPVAKHILAPVAIGYDRVIDGERDATLVLVYPFPVSEDNGFVYLPTFRSIYRLTDPALPLGVDPGIHPTRLTLLPQEPTGKNQPNWFAVPDGAVGRFPDAVVGQDNAYQGVVEEIRKALKMEAGGGKLPTEPQP